MEISLTRSPTEQLAILARCAPEFDEARYLVARGADPNGNFPGFNMHMLAFVIYEGEAEGVDLLYRLGSRLPADTTQAMAESLLWELQRRLIGKPAGLLADLKNDLVKFGGVGPEVDCWVPGGNASQAAPEPSRLQQLEQVLAMLLDAHAAGSIEGENDLFSRARAVYERGS